MKYTFQIFSLLSIMSLVSCGSVFMSKDDQVKKAILSDNAVFVDVRTPKEFEEKSLPEAKNIPLDSLEKQISFFKESPDKTYVLFCRSGKRAEKARKILKKNKIKKVYNGINITHIDSIKNEQHIK